jgi:hypothetical protein
MNLEANLPTVRWLSVNPFLSKALVSLPEGVLCIQTRHVAYMMSNLASILQGLID